MAGESPSKPLKVVGGFELIQKIGQGGMGSVFKARQISLDREVALKILPPKIAQKDAVFIERFIREARTSAKLNHANIVQGIEVGKDEATGLYYFAMEYVDGPTVKKLLVERKIIDEKKALLIIKGVTEALICAHKAGIVHRDIKPDNILLTSSGEPKLADLGLARLVQDASLDEQGPKDGTGLGAGNAELTQSGQAIGTPAYMAPEQIRGQNDDIDARTDLYELGATWFHMVTGRPPYQADGVQKVMVAHLNAPVPSAHAANSSVSEATSKIISKLLQKDKANRIQSAELLLAQLEKLIHAGEARSSGKRVAVTTKERPVGHERKRTEKQQPVEEEQPVKKPFPWMYVGIASVPCVIILVVIVMSLGGEKPKAPVASTDKPSTPKPEAQKAPTPEPPKPEIKDETPEPAQPLRRPNTPEPEVNWPALTKVLEYQKQKPDDYQTQIRMFVEAEKGAPPEAIPVIRHEKGKVERTQNRVFKPLFDDRSGQAIAKAGARDYASAMKLMEASAFPQGLLNEFAISEIQRVRSEIEARALDDYSKLLEPALHLELESAGMSIQKLQTLRGKLDQHATTYGAKAVVDHLEVLRRRVDVCLLAANAEAVRQQETAFRKVVDQAQAAAVNGDYAEAIGLLQGVRNDAQLKDRFAATAAQIARDVEAAQQLLLKACAAFAERAGKDEVVTLHPSGMTIQGRITAKQGQGREMKLTVEDKNGLAREVEVARLDSSDLVAVCGHSADAANARYMSAMYCYWQGRQKQAYDVLCTFKKESGAEADRAAYYLRWMNDSASAMITRVNELFWDVHSNTKLSQAEKEARKKEAQALARRLKNDLFFTEAYSAQNGRK
ncbi:MAG TPA: protein kinase [Planctomycetota bacterium]|nr:protein kinase [Planctomycetota bacterium]